MDSSQTNTRIKLPEVVRVHDDGTVVLNGTLADGRGLMADLLDVRAPKVAEALAEGAAVTSATGIAGRGLLEEGAVLTLLCMEPSGEYALWSSHGATLGATLGFCDIKKLGIKLLFIDWHTLLTLICESLRNLEGFG